jgi:hypothetical protein
MDMEDVRDQLERLFWGMIAESQPDVVPPGVEGIGIATASHRAIVIVSRREIGEVRAALDRIEAGLPHESVAGLIQKERARADKYEAYVTRMEREWK